MGLLSTKKTMVQEGMEYTIIGPINDVTKTSVEKFIISDDDYGVKNIGKPIIGTILVTLTN